jgi:hypothetical protein
VIVNSREVGFEEVDLKFPDTDFAAAEQRRKQNGVYRELLLDRRRELPDMDCISAMTAPSDVARRAATAPFPINKHNHAQIAPLL